MRIRQPTLTTLGMVLERHAPRRDPTVNPLARLTHDQVIAELRKGHGKWSRPKLSRIENREQGVKPREVGQLLDVYGVTDQDLRDWLLELASTAHERGWSSISARTSQRTSTRSSTGKSPWWLPGSSRHCWYRDYSRAPSTHALVTGVNPGLAEDEVERRVAARITRQQILTRTTPPHLHVILDAGVLERPVGTPLVMRNQLRRLAESADAPNITIQVLPKSVGASPALEGPFSILTLPDPMPDVGYSEGPGRAVYIEDRDDVRSYTLRFGILTEQSLSQAGSVKLITNAAKAMSDL